MAGPKLRAFRSRALLAALRGLSFAVRRLSRQSAQNFGALLGKVAGVVAVSERRKSLANMAIAFPEWSAAQRRANARAMFRDPGTPLLEVLWLTRGDENARAAATRFERIEPALESIRNGQSIVAFAGPCGNW